MKGVRRMFYRLKMKLRALAAEKGWFKHFYDFAHFLKGRVSRLKSDRRFALDDYKASTGKKLNLDHPVTFDDKVWWLKLHNRDPLLTRCSDKYAVRGYVEECGLGHLLNDLYGVYEKAEDIDFEKLPDQFILKTNHGCATNVICRDKASFDRAAAVAKLSRALKENYYHKSREWNYKHIKPRVICERLLEEKSPAGLVDYRFLCFDGVCKLVFADIETSNPDGTHYVNARRNVYDTAFNLLPVRFSRENYDPALVPKPARFDEMLRCAEILAKPFAHCRVDFYHVDGAVIFGEITFHHAGGVNRIDPPEWNFTLGSWIDLNSKKIVRLP